MSRRSLLLLLAGVLLGLGGGWYFLAGEPAYPITNVRPRGSTVIALGDSLTAGQGVAADQTYPAQLQQRLGVNILNRGVSGDTTEDALQRIEEDVLAADPRIVIVWLGGNDLLRRVPLPEMMDRLETIIRGIQERGALVILIGMHSPLSGRVADAYADLARRTGCPLVPEGLRGILGREALMLDSVHPNGQGYARLVDRIVPVLQPYLRQPAAAPP